MRKILLLVFIFNYPFFFAIADNIEECHFMKKVDEILLSDPVEDAKLNKHTDPHSFLAIANSRFSTVSIAGLSSEEELCVKKQHEFNFIDAGGDVIRCEDQVHKSKLLVKYSAKYNKQLVTQYKKLGLYKCAI